MRKHVTVMRDEVTHLITGITSEEQEPAWAAQLAQGLAQLLKRDAVAQAERDMLPPVPEPESLAKRLAKDIGPGKPGQVAALVRKNGRTDLAWRKANRG